MASSVRLTQRRILGVSFLDGVLPLPKTGFGPEIVAGLTLAAVGIPFIEVHLSNVFARESFRRVSYFSDIAVGIISGLGAMGYELALEFALRYARKKG